MSVTNLKFNKFINSLNIIKTYISLKLHFYYKKRFLFVRTLKQVDI